MLESEVKFQVICMNKLHQKEIYMDLNWWHIFFVGNLGKAWQGFLKFKKKKDKILKMKLFYFKILSI